MWVLQSRSWEMAKTEKIAGNSCYMCQGLKKNTKDIYTIYIYIYITLYIYINYIYIYMCVCVCVNYMCVFVVHIYNYIRSCFFYVIRRQWSNKHFTPRIVNKGLRKKWGSLVSMYCRQTGDLLCVPAEHHNWDVLAGLPCLVVRCRRFVDVRVSTFRLWCAEHERRMVKQTVTTFDGRLVCSRVWLRETWRRVRLWDKTWPGVPPKNILKSLDLLAWWIVLCNTSTLSLVFRMDILQIIQEGEAEMIKL